MEKHECCFSAFTDEHLKCPLNKFDAIVALMNRENTKDGEDVRYRP